MNYEKCSLCKVGWNLKCCHIRGLSKTKWTASGSRQPELRSNIPWQHSNPPNTGKQPERQSGSPLRVLSSACFCSFTQRRPRARNYAQKQGEFLLGRYHRRSSPLDALSATSVLCQHGEHTKAPHTDSNVSNHRGQDQSGPSMPQINSMTPHHTPTGAKSGTQERLQALLC